MVNFFLLNWLNPSKKVKCDTFKVEHTEKHRIFKQLITNTDIFDAHKQTCGEHLSEMYNLIEINGIF